ncbi:hypothetical protein M0534_08430 [Methylonatrum kenyense]|uniref:hypothetical protein n=1 Tax=Methylonatrum kenyense TaxID=455253 RepID=UPI0020C10B52|nr:hypothetical protein [Methylonatrum kenyense]MCK8516350.1 hypothetical protein [Methylonatrum kenyense]
MAIWECRIRAAKIDDARASLGPLADQTWEVQAEDAADAVTKVVTEIEKQRRLTTLPPDLLEDWLDVRERG